VGEVEALSTSSSGRLFDARARDRFAGQNETIDRVPGHIPGAKNLPFQENLKDGRFHAAAVLRERFEASLAGAPITEAVFYCGSGVTACHNLLAAELAGLSGARLFPGSYSEWIADGTRKVEV
jgi:thiosulfate/3-mercaptopyruvate sulfurtransferase